MSYFATEARLISYGLKSDLVCKKKNKKHSILQTLYIPEGDVATSANNIWNKIICINIILLPQQPTNKKNYGLKSGSAANTVSEGDTI